MDCLSNTLPLWNTRPRNVEARGARRNRSNTTVTILLCSGVQDGSGIAALLHNVSTDSWVWQRSHKGHANVRSFICVGHPHLWWPPTSCPWSTRACPTTEVATFSGCGVAPNRSPPGILRASPSQNSVAAHQHAAQQAIHAHAADEADVVDVHRLQEASESDCVSGLALHGRGDATPRARHHGSVDGSDDLGHSHAREHANHA